jgi:hypothetical protein
VPFDPQLLRVERFHAEMGHHAAFYFWNLRGVIAEKWGHGPYFGARGRLGEDVLTLTPETEAEDRRIQATYGLNIAGMLAEGAHWVPRAQEIVHEWFDDHYAVMKPRRVVRAYANVFALYPAPNAVQLSRRIRRMFYRHADLESTLPQRLAPERDSFHAAVDWFVPSAHDDLRSNSSLIAGVVTPMHRSFFAWPDRERDEGWWMGFNYNVQRVDDNGLEDPLADLRAVIDSALTEVEQIAAVILRRVLE